MHALKVNGQNTTARLSIQESIDKDGGTVKAGLQYNTGDACDAREDAKENTSKDAE